MKPERNAAAEPQTEARRPLRPMRDCRSGRAHGFRSGRGAVERGRGPTGNPWSGAKPCVGHGDYRRWRSCAPNGIDSTRGQICVSNSLESGMTTELVKCGFAWAVRS
jgi:hypothetical protein